MKNLKWTVFSQNLSHKKDLASRGKLVSRTSLEVSTSLLWSTDVPHLAIDVCFSLHIIPLPFYHIDKSGGAGWQCFIGKHRKVHCCAVLQPWLLLKYAIWAWSSQGCCQINTGKKNGMLLAAFTFVWVWQVTWIRSQNKMSSHKGPFVFTSNPWTLAWMAMNSHTGHRSETATAFQIC